MTEYEFLGAIELKRTFDPKVLILNYLELRLKRRLLGHEEIFKFLCFLGKI